MLPSTYVALCLVVRLIHNDTTVFRSFTPLKHVSTQNLRVTQCLILKVRTDVSEHTKLLKIRMS